MTLQLVTIKQFAPNRSFVTVTTHKNNTKHFGEIPLNIETVPFGKKACTFAWIELEKQFVIGSHEYVFLFYPSIVCAHFRIENIHD